MSNTLRIGLFNTQPDERESLEDIIGQVGALELALETDRWEDLEPALTERTLDLVLVNLDGDATFNTDVVERIVQKVPDMAIVGVSTQTSPNMIISAMRAGCSQFVCAPVDPADFRNAVDRIIAARSSVPLQSKRICVVGASGGVGATTVSCNLAMELAELVHRTCALVDLNLEYGDAASSFDCEPKYSLADLCGSGAPIDRTIVESAMHQLPCDVALLARPPRVGDARLVTPEGVEETLKILESAHPYIVIDLPREFSFLSSVAVNEADLILIVAQLSIPSVRNAARVYDVLLDMGAEQNRIEILLNRCRAEHQRVTPEDVEQHFRRPVFGMIPNDYRRVNAALDFGHPIVTDAPNSPARLAIHALAKKVATERRPDEHATSTARNKGMFKRWWSGSRGDVKTVKAP